MYHQKQHAASLWIQFRTINHRDDAINIDTYNIYIYIYTYKERASIK